MYPTTRKSTKQLEAEEQEAIRAETEREETLKDYFLFQENLAFFGNQYKQAKAFLDDVKIPYVEKKLGSCPMSVVREGLFFSKRYKAKPFYNNCLLLKKDETDMAVVEEAFKLWLKKQERLVKEKAAKLVGVDSNDIVSKMKKTIEEGVELAKKSKFKKEQV